MGRPDLHTEDHNKWDQGGYCNELVLDDDGSGEICEYRQPLPEPERTEATGPIVIQRKDLPPVVVTTHGLTVRGVGAGYSPHYEDNMRHALAYLAVAEHIRPIARCPMCHGEKGGKHLPIPHPSGDGTKTKCPNGLIERGDFVRVVGGGK